MSEIVKTFCNVQETVNQAMTVKELVNSKKKVTNAYKRLKSCGRQQRAQLKANKARQRKEKRQQDHTGTTSSSSSSSVATSSDDDMYVTNMAYCLFCDARDAQIQRHYKKYHADEPDVKEIIDISDTEEGRKEKRKKMAALRSRGNWLKGKRKLKTGAPSELVPVYVRSDGGEPKSKMVICRYCHKPLSSQYIAKHMKSGRCVGINERNDKEVEDMGGRDFVRSGRRETFVEVDDEAAKDVLMTMNDDSVTQLIRSDPLIRHYFVWLVEKYHRNGCCRTLKAKARDAARFLLFVRESSELSDMSQVLHPENWSLVRKLCLKWAGTDEHGTLKLASRPKRAGEVLAECCDRYHNLAISKGDATEMDKCKRWKKLFRQDFPLLSKESRDTRKEKAYNKAELFPLFADIERLSTYLDAQMSDWSDTGEVSNFRSMTRWLVAKLILFNRKRQGETSSILLRDYEAAVENADSRVNPDVLANLAPLEQQLVAVMFRIEFIGKKRNRAAALLTPTMMTALKKYVKARRKYVSKTVPFLFARPGVSKTPIKGCDCLLQSAQEAKCSNPAVFKSTGLRKHLATMTQSLHMSDNHKDLLARFMGHRLSVHESVYQLQMDTIQKSKIAQLLVRINNGNLDDIINAKSLDDIDVNFDVEFNDSDDEGMSRLLSSVQIG